MPITDRLLLGPGPSNPYPEAVAALGRPMLGHMDPEFIAIMDETMARLRTVFRTDNALTLPVSGTGSAGMEACFVNLVEPGDTVDRRRQRRVRRAHVRGRASLRCRRRAHRRASGAARSTRSGCSTRSASTPRRACSRSCTRRRRPASRTTSRRSPRCATPTRCCWSTPSRRSAASRSRSTGGTSTPPTPARRSASACRPASRRSRSRRARSNAIQTARAPAAVVVSRPVAHRQLRRRRPPRVPPHRADLDALRAARRARRRCSTRGSRQRGPGTRRSARGSRHALPELGFRLVRPRATASRSSPPRGCPRASTTPSCARRCSPPTTSRSAAASATFAGKAWRIGLMGHSARERSVTTLLGALRELLALRRRRSALRRRSMCSR